MKGALPFLFRRPFHALPLPAQGHLLTLPGIFDYYCRTKEAGIARFNLWVSEWKHREHFKLP